MISVAIIVSLLGMAHGKTLANCHAAHDNYCACNVGNSGGGPWCWMVHDGLKNLVKDGDGGYACASYNGYDSMQYCYNAKTGHPTTYGGAGHTAAIKKDSGGGGAAPEEKVSRSGNSLSTAQAQEILDIHNKMRCATGAGPLAWDPALAAQAQSVNHGFHHSSSYKLGIKSGENLAMCSGGISCAAKMWFAEHKGHYSFLSYGHGTGHFTAMVWKSAKKIGCASNNNVIRCQYAGANGGSLSGVPNMQGGFPANVAKPTKFSQCGLDSNLYEIEDTPALLQHLVSSPLPVVGASAGAFVMFILLGFAVRKRHRQSATTDMELLNDDEAETLE